MYQQPPFSDITLAAQLAALSTQQATVNGSLYAILDAIQLYLQHNPSDTDQLASVLATISAEREGMLPLLESTWTDQIQEDSQTNTDISTALSVTNLIVAGVATGKCVTYAEALQSLRETPPSAASPALGLAGEGGAAAQIKTTVGNVAGSIRDKLVLTYATFNAKKRAEIEAAKAEAARMNASFAANSAKLENEQIRLEEEVKTAEVKLNAANEAVTLENTVANDLHQKGAVDDLTRANKALAELRQNMTKPNEKITWQEIRSIKSPVKPTKPLAWDIFTEAQKGHDARLFVAEEAPAPGALSRQGSTSTLYEAPIVADGGYLHFDGAPALSEELDPARYTDGGNFTVDAAEPPSTLKRQKAFKGGSPKSSLRPSEDSALRRSSMNSAEMKIRAFSESSLGSQRSSGSGDLLKGEIEIKAEAVHFLASTPAQTFLPQLTALTESFLQERETYVGLMAKLKTYLQQMNR